MFRNSLKKRELIDRELEIYRQERTNAINKKMIELETKCATDTAEYEHTFHSNKERLGINIAKLEGLKETMENDVETYKLWIIEKDKEIERLNTLLTLMIKNQQPISVNTK
jgi:hypothetical protein